MPTTPAFGPEKHDETNKTKNQRAGLPQAGPEPRLHARCTFAESGYVLCSPVYSSLTQPRGQSRASREVRSVRLGPDCRCCKLHGVFSDRIGPTRLAAAIATVRWG